MSADRVFISVDEEECCGSAACVVEAPDVFDLPTTNGAGPVVLLLSHVPYGSALGAEVEAAADRCPTSCIKLSYGTPLSN
jgi:ferredoxin